MCLEIAFADIICKTLLKSNSRVLLVRWKMEFILKIAASDKKVMLISEFQEKSSLKRRVAEKNLFVQKIYKALLKPTFRVLSVL